MVTPAPSFDLAASSFINHLQIERGLAANSIAAYRRDLTKFQSFLDGTALHEVSPATIGDFESSLRAVKLSVASINRIDSTLRSFLNIYSSNTDSLIQPLRSLQVSPRVDCQKR